MTWWQTAIVGVFAFLATVCFVLGLRESRDRHNAYGLTNIFLPLGVIAWGDAVMFGPFWLSLAAGTFFLQDWLLFVLAYCVFWVVRSTGETMYWFNQQFSHKVYEWNKPGNLHLHSVFRNDSIWFGYQVMWQCITVLSILASIYVGHLWLSTA